MFNQCNYSPPKFSREIRLGLVVHGGISLAIYTHGVCQEFFHGVRGRGIYKLVKALTDSDLIVDAISGSSISGINGILLGYALANSNQHELVDFNKFTTIWRDRRNLFELLQRPNSSKLPVGALGLDNQDFYQRKLLATLITGVEQKIPRSPAEWLSTSRELDVKIVGTDYLGRVSSYIDEAGVRRESINHQVLFHLKHRQGRKEPFNPYCSDLTGQVLPSVNLPQTATTTYQALAKLCQITAGIPEHSALVSIDLVDRQNLVDRQLISWGNLTQYQGIDLDLAQHHRLYFLNGGLLANQPFTCIKKETYYRLPNHRDDIKPRLRERKLFYIDSDRLLIDSLSPQGRGEFLPEQDYRSTVFSTPISQSIDNDLRAIQEHNQKVIRYQTLLDSSELAVNSQQLLASTDRTQSQIYLRGRLFDLRDRNLPLLAQSNSDNSNSSTTAIFDQISNPQITTNRAKKYYHKLLNRFESQVVDLDVEYSIRHHFYLINRIDDILDTNPDPVSHQQLQNLSLQLSCNIKLLEVVRASIELLFKDRAVSNYFNYLVTQESSNRRLQALIYELIFRLHRFLLDSTRFNTFIPTTESGAGVEIVPVYFWLDLPELAARSGHDRWLSQSCISSVFAQMKQRILDLHQNTDLHRLIWTDRQLEYDRDLNHSFPSILKQIDLAATLLIEKSANQYTSKLLKQWHTFICLDREVYPFEYLTNLSDKELINPLGISPNNAQLGLGKGKKSQEKLANGKLYNVGGAFEKSWQTNDLIWGRLDGLNRILESIVTPQSVTAFAAFIDRETTQNNCSRAEYLDRLIMESLPQLSGLEWQTIRKHLERLAQPHLQIDRVELRHILADLVLAGHKEILTSESNSVLETADEQPGWWQLPQTSSTAQPQILTDLSAPISNPSKIGRITRQSLAKLAAQQQQFFHHQYRIGIDKLWENMPLVTLISFGTKTVLILRRILLTFFGISSPTQTMRHPLYHWLDGNLQSLYWWLQGGSIKLGAAHRRPRIILLQSLSAVTAIGGIALAFLSSPFWLLFSLPGATICWFLQTMRLKRLTPVKTTRFLPQSRRRD